MKISTDVSAYFYREAREIRRLVKKILRRPTEDRIHELRVSLRKERTVLKVLEREGTRILTRKEQRTLQRIWRDLGRNRDLDVASNLATQFHLSDKTLQKGRKKAEQWLFHDLKRKSTKKLLKKLCRIAQREELKNFRPVKSIEKLKDKVIACDQYTDNLHEYRIILKEVRYLLESLNVNIARFKKFQDILGTVNDIRLFIKQNGGNRTLERAHEEKLKEAQKVLSLSKKMAIQNLSLAKEQML